SERFVQQVGDIFRSKAVILSYSPDPSSPPIVASEGIDAAEPLVEALTRSLKDAIAASGRPQMEITAEEMRGPAGVLARRNGFETALVARVARGGEMRTLLGVLAGPDQGFTRQSDAPLLHLLARQATIALDNAILHERTRIQARAMEEQAEKLEKAMTERSRFFASMSHELRTPINAVIGYNQLLEIGAFGIMSEEQAKAVSRVSRNAQHLLELINDILDISKIEAGKMEISIQRTNLRKLIEDTVATVQIQADEKGLELIVETDADIEVSTDEARARQILLNLLSNAIKFT